MQDKMQLLAGKINALSLRERVLILLACLVAMQQAWDSWVWRPLVAQQDQQLTRQEQAGQEMLQLQVDMKILSAKANNDPDREIKARVETLRQQLAAVNQQIEKTSESLVAPAEMAKLLERLLISEPGLELVSLQTLDSVPLISAGEKEQVPNNYQIYRHEFSIEFEGSYLSTLRYLEALQKLPWTFFQQGIEYRVDSYPVSRVKLNLYTLSLSPGWIGI